MQLPPDNHTNPSLLIIECGLAAFSGLLAYAWPSLGKGLFAKIERGFARLARRKILSVVVVGVSVIVLRLAILPLFPIPLPIVPDDFSFLLAADTFAHGRLTNPTPAMWTHFETIHVTMHPTYQSMYFPGQGLVLAASKVVFGTPWMGLVIVSALMCGALCWMLRAWLPANWALLGGFIAVIRLGVFSYWTNTYHAAGSLSALGGALILGALPRLLRGPRWQYAALLGTGIAILVITRPYEGLLLCIPTGVMIGLHILKKKPHFSAVARLTSIPILFGVVAVGWLGYYDYRAFGKATTLPYTLDRNQYALTPYYIWQQLRPEPPYRYEQMQRFYELEADYYRGMQSARGFVTTTLSKVGFAFLFYSGALFFLPMIMARRVFLDHRIRFLLWCTLTLVAGMAIEVYILPHYLAAFTTAFYAVGLQAMRHLRLWKPEGRAAGLTMVRLIVVSCLLLVPIRILAKPLGIAPPVWPVSNWNNVWSGPEQYGIAREGIQRKLEGIQGKQLVLVRYIAVHYPMDEWVYNGADIDAAKVVWARDMNPTDNEELIRYYGDRTVWLAQPDQAQSVLVPYPVQREPGTVPK